MSQSTTFCAGNAAMCFLPYVLRSGRTGTAVRSSGGYVLHSQGESAEMAIDGKVDEKMENIGFVWTGGIPGLRRMLRPQVLLRMEPHAQLEMSQMGPTGEDDSSA